MSSLKPLTGALVRAANEAYAEIALGDKRADELTIELSQLRSAIENAHEPVLFDADPSDFRATLLALSAGEGR